MRKDLLEGLTEEQIAKVKECKDHAVLLELAKKEGVQLTEEQLQTIAGGDFCDSDHCPQCGSGDIGLWREYSDYPNGKTIHYMCKKCFYEWTK